MLNLNPTAKHGGTHAIVGQTWRKYAGETSYKMDSRLINASLLSEGLLEAKSTTPKP